MAKTTLKIVERKTTVPRENFKKAFKVVYSKPAVPNAKRNGVVTEVETLKNNTSEEKKS